MYRAGVHVRPRVLGAAAVAGEQGCGVSLRVTLGDETTLGVRATLSHPQADHAVAPGECPRCHAAPYRVRGCGVREVTHDTYVASAICVDCGEPAGVLRAQVATIFGIEEDEAVLFGRCRVY